MLINKLRSDIIVMLANERYKLILKMVKYNHSVTVPELTEKFGVSTETVRRDLAYLEEKKLLLRVHGGAVELDDKMRDFSEISIRKEKNQDLKHSLSVTASNFVSENDIIALDSGSTAVEFIKVLCEAFNMLTVATFSKDVADYAIANSHFKVISLGGNYFPLERVYLGYMTEENIDKLHIMKSFVFPSSVSLKYGISINVAEIYNLEKKLLNNCDKSFILADSSKFETVSPIKLCEISDVGTIITDNSLDEHIYRHYIQKNIDLVK